MKKILSLAVLLAFGFGMSSCKKCVKCTYNDAERGTLTEEFCDKGQSYRSTLSVYERQGWDCQDQ